MIEICKDFGIEIPADKHAEFSKVVAENYKTIAEVEKKVTRLESERDAQKSRADTAEETLKGFEGIDPSKLNEEIANWKKKAEEAEQNARKQLDERDFNDALKTELEGIKFTSTAAKKSVEAEIRAAGLKLKDGKILGLSDLIEQMKKGDASAFVDEHQQNLENNKARFTQASTTNGNTGGTTIKDIMKIKNPVERQKAIGQNMHLFGKGE